MNTLINPKLQLALAAVVMAAGLGVTPDAGAVTRMSITGGAACKAASGPGASVFYFDTQLTQNTSTSVQYLTCYIPEISPDSSRGAVDIQVVLLNPTNAAISFTCVIQAGYAIGVLNSKNYIINVPAGTHAELATSQPPARPDVFAPYVMSCAIPAQGQINLITVKYPETIS